jgi:hypothetical protein
LRRKASLVRPADDARQDRATNSLAGLSSSNGAAVTKI